MRLRPLGLVLVLGVGGCSPSLPPVPAIESIEAWRAYSDALDPRLGAARSAGGTWRMGDATSTFTRWSASGLILAIHEEMSLGEYGGRRVRYYYRDGLLRYVRDRGTVLAGGARPELKPLEREVLFAPDGQVLASINRIDGRDEPLDPLLASGVREHALVLEDVDATAPAE